MYKSINGTVVLITFPIRHRLQTDPVHR